MSEPVEVTQADIDLHNELWKMSVNWGNREEMTEMIARHRTAERDKLAGELVEAEHALKHYKDMFCEYPDYEFCGKMTGDHCSGCVAKAFLSRHEGSGS